MKIRRLIAVFIALLLLLGALPTAALAAVGAGWDDDCRGNPSGDGYGKHKWVKEWEDPTGCTSPMYVGYTCAYCGVSTSREAKAPGHKWGSWQTVKEATCTQNGQQTRKCSVCGETEKRTTDKGAHSWGAWTVTQEATCTATGARERKCQACGEVQKQTIAKTEHTWGDWVIVIPAGDFSMGKRSHSCKVCTLSATEDYYPDPTYKRGDRGDGVKALQEGLNAAGYDCGAADGVFGGKTEAAVQAIETAHGVTADGIAWPGVQKWLFGAGDDLSETQTTLNGDKGPSSDAIPGEKANISLKNLNPDASLLEPVFRSFEVVDTSKSLYDIEQGDVVEVRLRLTIDSYDDYDLLALEPAPGDSISHEDWMDETLQAGRSYECTYTMAIVKSGSDWTERTIEARLLSHSTDMEESEPVSFGPIGVPATVTLEKPGGDSHIINGVDAYLYLTVHESRMDDHPYIGDNMDVCFDVDTYSVYGTVIRDLRLVCEQQLHGITFNTSRLEVADSLETGKSLKNLVRPLFVSSVEGYDTNYTLSMHLEGRYTDEKGKDQTVTSLPVEMPLYLVDYAAQKEQMILTASVSPEKATYLMNDKVTIRLYVSNEGSQALSDVTIQPTDAYAGLRDSLSAGLGDTAFMPGANSIAQLEYRITREDAERGWFACEFVASGKGANDGTPVRSKRVEVHLAVDANQMEEKIAISAAMAEPKLAYPTETPLPYALTVKNETGSYISTLRIYAVGDNRYGYTPEGVEWHDLGHGMKGTRCGLAGNIGPGETQTFTLSLTIPENLTDQIFYYPRWIVEADLVNGPAATVRSNVAALTLLIAEPEPDAEPAVSIHLTGYEPDKTVQPLDTTVAVHAAIPFTGDLAMEDFKVWFATEAHPEEPVYGEVTNIVGHTAYAEFEPFIDANHVVNSVWSARFHVAVDKYQLEAETVPLNFAVDFAEADAAKEVKGLTLTVKQLTESADVFWHDLDQVDLAFSVTCVGEAMPRKIVVMQFTGEETEVGELVALSEDSWTLDQVFTLTLDAGQAVHSAYRCGFIAFADLSDDSPDLVSDPVDLVFPLEGYYDDPENQKKSGKINWSAIHAFDEATQDGEGSEAENGGPEGEEKPAEVPEAPEQPAEPGEGEKEPEQPAEPEKGEGEESPDAPEAPVEPGKVEGEKSPETPEQPAEPEPGEGEKTPDAPEAPAEPEKGEGGAADKSPDPSAGGDSAPDLAPACVLQPLGKAPGYEESAVVFCAGHAPAATQTRALAETGGAEAWKQAATLWAEALNAEYDALAGQLPGAAAALVEADRAQTAASLKALRAALLAGHDEAAAAEALAKAAMLRCAQLCELRHALPEQPAGLTLTANALPSRMALDRHARRQLILTENGALLREALSLGLFAADREAQALLDRFGPAAVEDAVGKWLDALDAAAREACASVDGDAAEAVAAFWSADRKALDARKALLDFLYPNGTAAGALMLRQVRASAIDISLLAGE